MINTVRFQNGIKRILHYLLTVAQKIKSFKPKFGHVLMIMIVVYYLVYYAFKLNNL